MIGRTDLATTLRQMLALLEAERQALAGLNLDAIMAAAVDKQALCGTLACAAAPDEECRALLEAARRMNEVNRQIRNLVAANVAARLDALTGAPALYRAGSVPRAGYAYTGKKR